MRHQGLLAIFVALSMACAQRESAALQEITSREDARRLFAAAAEAYGQQRFDEARDAYESLVAAGYGGGTVLYNLGNTYYKLGQIGEARLNYERARRLIPRDDNLRSNLAVVKAETVDEVGEDDVPRVMEKALFWHFLLNRVETARAFVFAYAMFWCFVALRVWWKRPAGMWAMVVALACCLLIGVSLAEKVYSDQYNRHGIVVAKEISVRSGKGDSYGERFKLHEGTRVFVESSEESWVLVRLPGDKRGWAKVSEVAVI